MILFRMDQINQLKISEYQKSGVLSQELHDKILTELPTLENSKNTPLIYIYENGKDEVGFL